MGFVDTTNFNKYSKDTENIENNENKTKEENK
jgi:hypothetical protein